MSKNPIDQNHEPGQGRAKRYPRLARITSGEATHPAIQLLARRSRKGSTDASRVKQFVRIARGNLV